MYESKLSEVIKTSLEGIKPFTDINSVVGNAIETQSGVTVIPVSKITVGFANGGLDFGNKRTQNSDSFGCGGGTGVSITPEAFLVITNTGDVNLIPLSTADNTVDKITTLIERAPEIIGRFRNM